MIAWIALVIAVVAFLIAVVGGIPGILLLLYDRAIRSRTED
jgi:hypothetical protein